jgi:heptosyltransferase-3
LNWSSCGAAGLHPTGRESARLLPALPLQSRILLIRLRSIGDIVLLTPALAMLKAWRPDLVVSVLVEARFRDLLAGNPDIDEVLELCNGGRTGRAAAPLRLLRELRRRRFALCLNLHGGPRSTWLTAFSGARWKAGFHHYRARRIYDLLVPDARMILGHQDVHTAELQAAALYFLGLPPTRIPRARLVVKPELRQWWQAKRSSFGLALGQGYAVMHPAALYPTKQWAAEKFAAIGRFLEEERGLAPIYTCGPGESATLDAVERAAARRLRRLEGASLGELAAALGEARLFLGNDSGPAHMAAALGRPLVVIFGSSSSRIWGPWPRPAPAEASLVGGQHFPAPVAAAARVVQNPYDCNPCPGDRCYRFERPECILSVGIDQVRDAIDSVLGAGSEVMKDDR